MKTLFPDVVVNGETIPAAVIAAETQNHEGPSGKPGIAWRKAANAIALRTLLLQEARRRGLKAKVLEVGPGRFETEEEALVRGLLDIAIDVAAPTEDAVRAEWEKNPERFRSAPLWEVSHILVACDPRDAEATGAAEVVAKELTARAFAAPNHFADLAREVSDCGSKAQGGALGQLRPGDCVPEFETALRDLQQGQITTAPVLTRHGWHIIRMDAMAKGAVLPFDAARPKIAEAMEKAAWSRAAHDFVQTLVGDAQIIGADLKPVQAPPNPSEV